LRGTTDEASALFREGMRAYVAGDYQAAAAELERAAKLDSSRPDIAYFLGIARLMNGNTAEAIGALERTIAMGDSPFLGDAHFYLAKAHLTDGDVASARSELEAAAALAGGGQSEAVRLLSDLNELDLR
jgi:tetratricopeptide (TPR) repeat protein